MGSTAALERYYESSLDDVQGMRARLERELALENEYQEVVLGIIRQAGADAELPAYTTRTSFSGGAANLRALLALAAKEVDEAARASVGAVPFHCGPWPDARLNARNVRVGDGGVIYVDTGLLVVLRFAAQHVARSLEAITGRPDFGPDDRSVAAVSELLVDTLGKYRRGTDPRVAGHVLVMRGPREAFRRQLNYLAVAYVLAHELGHLLDPDAGGPRYLSVAEFLRPRTEQDEMASWVGEARVDDRAYAILSGPPLRQGTLAPVTVMAPMLVSGIQAALWWMDRADGSPDFGWSHPAPDIRLVAAMERLAPERHPQMHEIAVRFRDWMWDVLRIERWRNGSKERQDAPQVRAR